MNPSADAKDRKNLEWPYYTIVYYMFAQYIDNLKYNTCIDIKEQLQYHGVKGHVPVLA